MGESFLITLREGFEAGLVVAIVFAFLRRTNRLDLARVVWAGVALALVISVVAGIVLQNTLGGLEGLARVRSFGAISIVASALLLWMIFWMRSHARHIKGEVEHRMADALRDGSHLGLALVAFLAVIRDGLETALFLIASTESELGRSSFLGALLGVAVATLLAVGVYRGSRRVPLRSFFRISGVVMILFAGGLLTRGVAYFQAAGDLGSMNGALYNLTGQTWLTTSTESGKFLSALFGWDPRPSAEQVLAWLAFVVPALLFFFWEAKRPDSPVAPPADVVPPSSAADDVAPARPPARV